MTQPRPPAPRWLELGPTPARGGPVFVLAAQLDVSRCLGAVFVGPFAPDSAAEAWARLERAYGYSGATFYVFARLDGPRIDLEQLQAGADAVMREIVYYTVGETTSLERYVVAARAGERLVLEADDRLPTYPSAAAAWRSAERAGEGALALVGLRSRWWHIHM